ncbi:MAG TPA: hypothetical protein VGP36_13720 [Mycobacteriales bacterium]|jgi:hypothetical protein|nr:hypothetical protein [Mycobacteriales bacterium]
MSTQTTNGELPTRAARRAAGGAPTLHGDRLPVSSRQRRPMLALLALVLILGGAALAATLVLSSGKKQEYLLVSHDVALGQTLTASDFKQQALASTNSSVFAPVPVADFYSRVDGKKALVALTKGSLLTQGTFGPEVTPAVGLGQLSLTVPEGRYPAGIAAGDVVKVLYTPSNANTNNNSNLAPGEKPMPRGSTLVAAAFVTSVGTSSSGQNGVIVGIDIKNVERADSPNAGLPAVAAANAANAITVVRLDPGHDYDKGAG